MENIGKIIRTVALIAVGGFLIALVIFNVSGGSTAGEKAWDLRTTIGNHEAKNHFIMYTDLACPYCDVFSRAVMENEEEFQQLIAENDIMVEIRLMDFLYHYGESKPEMSKWSAEATVCATEKDKFWDYYHAGLKALWDDYHSKGIGTSKTAPKIEGMTRDYWVNIGEKVGLDKDEFSTCMDSEETTRTLAERREKTLRSGAQGMPYFVEGKFKQSGFDNTWGWEEAKTFLTAGI
ncbi:thioredoxin domain-containing protein [Candidatus Saccharibacteria bacterium]|nr:thioredoxin domain-containing protein [Candidatus Saccharibacteria bacterium]